MVLIVSLNVDSENESARESFKDLLTDWVCTTGQNFELIDDVTDISDASRDGTNVVTFASTNAPSDLFILRRMYRKRKCYNTWKK